MYSVVLVVLYVIGPQPLSVILKLDIGLVHNSTSNVSLSIHPLVSVIVRYIS